MEVVLEDQILQVDKTQEATPDANLSKKLLKKEQRLSVRLQEEQEAEARAQDRFQRAQTRLQRRLNRLERISSKLLLVRKQIADLQITDQQSAHTKSTLVMPATFEAEALSPSQAEYTTPTTSEPKQEVTAMNANLSDLLAAHHSEEGEEEQGLPVPQSETPARIEGTTEPEAMATFENTTNADTTLEARALSSSQAEYTTPTTSETEQNAATVNANLSDLLAALGGTEQEPVASANPTAVEAEIDATHEVDTSPDSIMKRVPTKPLQFEQEDQHAAGSFSPDILSAKETWVAAETALQNARNAAHGIAASISFLFQSDGLSNELMQELVRKQADANKALLKAHDAARVAYEHFVRAQKDAEHAANQPVDTSINTPQDHSQQKQENRDLPPVEENWDDQTTKLHAIRLYKEW
jgi:hypothetical protein